MKKNLGTISPSDQRFYRSTRDCRPTGELPACHTLLHPPIATTLPTCRSKGFEGLVRPIILITKGLVK